MATITKRGDKWRVQVRRIGHEPVSGTFATKSEAKKWALQVEGRLAGNGSIEAPTAKAISLREALKRYLDEVTPTKKGAKQEAVRIRAWLSEPLAEQSLKGIRSQDIAAWRSKLVKSGKAPTTVKNALTIISQVYETSRTEWGFEGVTNPVRGVRMPNARPGRDRRLQVGEEPRLLAACQRWGIHGAVTWAIETAMRQGEQLALRWCDIEGRVAVARDTKAGGTRSVPLSTRALAALQSMPKTVDSQARIFSLSSQALDHRFRTACRVAEIAGLRWHDLRHEAVSRLFERGLDPFEVASISGHKTLTMLKRYTHHRAERLASKLG